VLHLLALVSLLVCSLAPVAADAQDVPPRRPGSSLVTPERGTPEAMRAHAGLASLQRRVNRFDFEDADRFPTELPRDWYRLLSNVSNRPGYPEFGQIELTERIAHGGRWSLQFTVNGGSMAVALPPGIVRIFPGSRYRISCWLRTDGLQRSGVRVTARLHDKDGKVTGHEWSVPVTRSGGEWKQVGFDVPEIPPEATDIAFELELVQPGSADAGQGRPIGDDVRGFAWFDDLEVWQIPSIRFTSGRDSQVFGAHEQVELEVELRDLVSDQLTAEVTITDIDGVVVHRSVNPLLATGAAVRVPISPQQPGAYRAVLAVAGEGMVVARRSIDLAIIDSSPKARSHRVAPTFGLILPPSGDGELPLIQKLVLQLDPDFAVIPAWLPEQDESRATARIAAVGEVIDALLDRRIEPVLSFESLPTSIAASRHLDTWQALAFFGSTDPAARVALEPWLLAFGSHVDQWQIGGIRSPAALTAFDRVQVTRMYTMLSERVASPALLLPAEIDREDGPAPPGIERHLRIPWSVRPGTAREYLAPWAGSAAIVTLELAPSDSLPERARTDDLALRTLDAWRNGATALAIELPWHASGEADGGPPSLLPEALAWREIGRVLSGRSFVAELPVANGLRAWIADGASGPVIIAWSEWADDATQLETLLANGPVSVTDMFGRQSTVRLDRGIHHVPLSSSPVVIQGIDLDLAKLLASAQLQPLALDSRRGSQNVVIALKNPFPVGANGTIAIADQPQWEISPRHQTFSMPAGGEAHIPIRVTLPRSVTSGEAELLASIEFTASESYATQIRMRTSIDWPAVRIDRSWRYTRAVDTGHVDVAVMVSVTNMGAALLDLDAFAMASGYTQVRKPILKLAPGETAVRVFQFPGGARRLGGQAIFAGVNELDGDRRLARNIMIPPLVPRPSPATVDAEDN